MKRGAWLIIILGILIISLAYFAYAGCVTYSQARANGITGTDAELRAKGFCADAGTTTGTQTTAQVDTSDLAGKTTAELMEIWLIEQNAEIYDQSEFDVKWEQVNNEFSGLRDKLDAEAVNCIDACFKSADPSKVIVMQYCDGYCDETSALAELNKKEDEAYKALYIEEIIKVRAVRQELEAAGSAEKVETPSTGGGYVWGKTGSGETTDFENPLLYSSTVFKEDGNWHLEGSSGGFVLQDDQILTQSTSYINLGGAGISIGEDSQLTLIEDDEEEQAFALDNGLVHTVYDSTSGKAYEVRLPNAAINTLGAEFTLFHDKASGMSVVMLEKGSINVGSSVTKENVLLSAGQTATINSKGEIGVSATNPQQLQIAINQLKPSTSLNIKISYWMKIYIWVTFAVVMTSLIVLVAIAIPINTHAKSQQRDKNKKDLSKLSLIFSILGIVTVLIPIIGCPLSVTGGLLGLIQKMQRNPTTTAKIGNILGIIGWLLNTLMSARLLILYSGL